jgi:deoxyribonuclease-4
MKDRPPKHSFTAGVHTSIAGGLANAVAEAAAKRCDCFQIFARNPRGWHARPLDRLEVHRFRSARDRAGLWPLAIHTVYLVNLAAQDAALLARSRDAFRDEIKRAVRLRADYLVVHPGAAGSAGEECAIATIVESIRASIRDIRLAYDGTGAGLTVLIENTAGQGSAIGRSFEQVAAIVDLLDDIPVGACIDTAHTLAAGYDLATPGGFRATVRRIDQTIGFERVRLIHCNDSKAPLGARVDRHEHIGLGHLGDETFRRLTHTLKFRRVPFILETPIDTRHGDDWNLNKIRELAQIRHVRPPVR